MDNQKWEHSIAFRLHREFYGGMCFVKRVQEVRCCFYIRSRFSSMWDMNTMGSPLGPLLADVFMSHNEENLEREGKFPSFYRRSVDDTLPSCPIQHLTSSTILCRCQTLQEHAQNNARGPAKAFPSA